MELAPLFHICCANARSRSWFTRWTASMSWPQHMVSNLSGWRRDSRLRTSVHTMCWRNKPIDRMDCDSYDGIKLAILAKQARRVAIFAQSDCPAALEDDAQPPPRT